MDRVIHLVSSSRGRFSHTDRGQKGILDFFTNHKCDKLCGLLGFADERGLRGERGEKERGEGPGSPTTVSAIR